MQRPATTSVPHRLRHRSRSHRDRTRRPAPLRLPSGKPAHVVLDLEHRDRVLESRIVRRERHGDRRVPAFAPLGPSIRSCTSWRASPGPSARASRLDDDLVSTLDEVVEIGVQPRGDEHRAKRSSISGRGGGEFMIRVGISAVDRRGRPSQPGDRDPRLGFPGVQARRAEQLVRGDSTTSRSRAATDGERTDLLDRPLPLLSRPEPVQRHRRPLPGHGPASPHCRRPRPLHRVLPVGHLPRHASAATIVEPERTRDFLETFLAQYEQGGRLAGLGTGRNETDCMIGYHSVSVIADAWRKGIRELRRRRWPCEAMLDSARRDHFGLRLPANMDSFPPTDESESVSQDSRVCLRRLVHRAHGRGAGQRTTSPPSSTSAPGLAPPLRPADQLPAPARERRLDDALRSTPGGLPPHRGQRLAVPLLGPARCRRIDRRHGRRRCFVAALDSLFDDRQRDHRPRPGRHHRPDRPVRPRQRAEPPRGLALSLRGPPGPERAARADASSTRCTATRPTAVGQRGLRADVELVRA